MSETFIHPAALCESNQVGSGTRIGAFAHILPSAQIGNDCNICDHVLIESNVIVGNHVTVNCGVQLWDGVRLEDDVFVGPNATFTNNSFSRSKQNPAAATQTLVRKGASVGANATILPGVTIGANAMIGAGAVVTRSVPPHAIVVGNPARIVGYTDTADHTIPEAPSVASAASSTVGRQTSVRGVTLHKLKRVEDMRGTLSVGEFGRDIPFEVKRYFLVYDVPSLEIRGEHAHLLCEQFLIAVKGSVHVVADDGSRREQFILDQPDIGLYLPPMTWGIQYRYSADATLLVLASRHYDSQDYVRDYDHFLELAHRSS